MRTWFILALLVVAGIGIGVGVSLGLFTPSPNAPWPAVRRGGVRQTNPRLAPSGGPQPRVQVDKTEYDFGEMDRQAKGRHSFVVTNTGKYPLKLAKGDTTCKCTRSDFDDEEVQPGKSTEFTLEWEAKSDEEHFRQSATIFTNDPNQRSITLTVSGRLIQSLTLMPPELVFNNVTPESHTEGKARLLVQTSQPVKITGHSLTEEATAGFYEVSYTPLAEKDVPTGFKSAWEGDGDPEIRLAFWRDSPENPPENRSGRCARA